MKAVAEADVRVDARPVRQGLRELHAQLAHVHVDAAVAAAERPAPGSAVQVLPHDDPARALDEHAQQPELVDGEVRAWPPMSAVEWVRSTSMGPERSVIVRRETAATQGFSCEPAVN